MEIGWTKPKEAPADQDDAKIKVTNFNSRALNALFSAITNKEFKKISSTETTKETYTILQTNYEETKVVKDSKLQRLATSFKEIKMKEDESFDDFYATSSRTQCTQPLILGKPFSNPRLLEKLLNH